MEWIISAAWVLGAAFYFGWHQGNRAEEGWDHSEPPMIWVAWPAYRLGYTCGRRYTERKLAPERMKAKLLQDQRMVLPAAASPYFTVQATSASPTWIGGMISGTTNTP